MNFMTFYQLLTNDFVLNCLSYSCQMYHLVELIFQSKCQTFPSKW